MENKTDSLKIGWVELFVTEDCNLSCKYCFHHKEPKTMTSETLDKALSFLQPYLQEDCVFSFFGGEPLLRVDFILEAIAKIQAQMPYARFFMSTNATIYSEEIIEKVLEPSFTTMQVSYDGLSQDTLRGSSALVQENISKYLEILGPKKLHIRMTFTPETVSNLCDDIVHMYNLGLRYIMHNAEYSDRWTDENIEEYKIQLDKIYAFSKDRPDLSVRFADCNAALADHQGKRCAAGRQMISVSALGDIYPCHRAVAFKEFKIGNVYEGRLNRGMFITLKMKGCEGCKASSTCHSCFMANYEYTHSLKNPLKCSCDINLIEYHKAVEVFGVSFDGQNILMLKSMIPVLEDVLETSLASKELVEIH